MEKEKLKTLKEIEGDYGDGWSVFKHFFNITEEELKWLKHQESR